MRCMVCDALQREQSLMNQIEAASVIEQRYRMIIPPPPDNAARKHDHDQDLQEIVLFSRKRQAKIAFSLQRHQDREHAA
jgi:hypothetical protein